MKSSRSAPWAPPVGLGITLMPTGEQWDAVRVSEPLGDRALAWLGHESGAVVCDPYAPWLYWSIPVGSELSWESLARPGDVQRLGVACWVAIPGTDRRAPPGPYWMVPYLPDAFLTDPDALHQALAIAAAASTDKRKPYEGDAGVRS